MTIAAAAIDEIVAHAREAAPAECCGLLLGRGPAIVESARTRNIATRPTRFEIDPQDHIDRRRAARARGLDVVGFYHSHPVSPPLPSEADRAEAAYPNHLYLIVGLASDPPEVRLFSFDGRNFREEPFVTSD
jgi:proteasome lid subunit RPN8/RPN11